MQRFVQISKVLFVLAIVVVIAVATAAYAGKGGGKKPPKCQNFDLVCTDVYDPVICDDGVTYSNQCYADRACATGCEPVGPGPTPVAQGEPPSEPGEGQSPADKDESPNESVEPAGKGGRPAACCNPDDEPGVGDNPFCFEGHTCCSDGQWRCNNADASPSCEPGEVCAAGCANRNEACMVNEDCCSGVCKTNGRCK